MTSGSANTEPIGIMKVPVLRDLILSKVESLKVLKQHRRRTMDPVEFSVLKGKAMNVCQCNKIYYN
jgi:hypothetical protein